MIRGGWMKRNKEANQETLSMYWIARDCYESYIELA